MLCVQGQLFHTYLQQGQRRILNVKKRGKDTSGTFKLMSQKCNMTQKGKTNRQKQSPY